MNIFLLSCSWHERIIYRASGVKLVLCGHGKGRRDLSAEHSMRVTVGYGDPARGQARELWRFLILPWLVSEYDGTAIQNFRVKKTHNHGLGVIVMPHTAARLQIQGCVTVLWAVASSSETLHFNNGRPCPSLAGWVGPGRFRLPWQSVRLDSECCYHVSSICHAARLPPKYLASWEVVCNIFKCYTAVKECSEVY